MDYSKLSNDELIALKNGDYSKLSNDMLTALKNDSSVPSEPKKTLKGFAANTLKDFSSQARSNLDAAAYSFPPAALMKLGKGENIYDPALVAGIGKASLEGIKEIPGRIKNEVLHPINSAYKAPLSTALDAAMATSLAGGIAKPALSGLRKFAFNQMEESSGLAPSRTGILERAYKDPTLMFEKSKKSVGPTYQQMKTIGGEVSPELASQPDKLKFIQEASKRADKNELLPTEALEARKELDSVKKSVTNTFFRETREKLDKIAKVAFEVPDTQFARSSDAEALRNLGPRNMKGKFSSFKAGGGAVMAKTGGPVGKLIAAGAFSPAVQGSIATGLGAVNKIVGPIIENAPGLASASAINSISKAITKAIAREYLKKSGNDKDKARELAKADGYDIKNR